MTALAFAAMSGCSVGGEAEENLGSAREAISDVIPGVAEVVSDRYLPDPEVARSSYAIPEFGCGAAMIGPQIAITAAHCGGPRQLTFRLYSNRDRTKVAAYPVSCDWLYQSFNVPAGRNPVDVLLAWCDKIATASGPMGPGDVFGYLDLDLRRPEELAPKHPVYSVWPNAVNRLNLGMALLWSPGQVTFNSGLEFQTDIWGWFGASGSPMLAADTHRLLGAPTQSAGQWDANGNWIEGPWRRANGSIGEAMANGWVDYYSPVRPQTNDPLILSLNLTPSSYDGLLDKDGDRVFDIQRDLEGMLGETRRDHYYLGFDSERRNRVWWPARGSFQPNPGYLTYSTQSAADLADHARLNTRPNTNYRFTIYTYAAQGTSGFEIGFVYNNTFQSRAILPTSAAGAWEQHVFRLNSAYSNRLRLRTRGPGNGALMHLSMIEEGSVMNFDTADKRVMWRNENDGRRAWILPDGRGAGPSWAAYVPRDLARGNNDWPLRDLQLALVPGDRYRVCFQHRSVGGVSYPSAWGRAQNPHTTAGAATVQFNPGPTWQRTCFDDFTAAAGAYLRFGNFFPDDGAAYLVDDIEIIRQ
jgi:hypothetical protein